MNVDKLKQIGEKDGQLGIYDYGHIDGYFTGLKEGLIISLISCTLIFFILAMNNMAWISKESQGTPDISKRLAGKVITLTGELAMCIDNNPGDTCSMIYGVRNGNTINFGWYYGKINGIWKTK